MAYGEFAKIYDELINEDINYDEMVDCILRICNENNIEFNDPKIKTITNVTADFINDKTEIKNLLIYFSIGNATLIWIFSRL